MTLEAKPNQSAAPAKQCRSARLAPFALLAIGLALYLPLLGSFGPLDPTDSFFLESAREMVETKQYLLPLMNYVPWLDKPILYFWAVAGSYQLFHMDPFFGRLFTALSAVLMGLFIYLSARPVLGLKVAFLSGVLFYAFPLSSVIGHVSLTDMPLTTMMAGSLLALFHYLHRGGLWILILAYLALALAFLCKGPIAVILVVAIFGAYRVLCATKPVEIVEDVFKLKPLLGLFILAVINLPWYTAATIGTKGAFFRDFFITQNFGRMVGTVNHQQPFWFYIPVVAAGLFPASLFLFSLPNLPLKLIKDRKRLSQRSSYIFFLLVWSVFVLTLFSIIKTKLPTYILPAVPALAILSAYTVTLWSRLKQPLKLLPTALLLAAAATGGILAAPKVKGWAGHLLLTDKPLLIIFLLVSLLYLFLLIKRKTAPALTLLFTTSILASAIVVPQAFMIFYEDRQKPFEELLLTVQGAGADLATVIVEEPSTSYFLHRRIPCIKTPQEARDYLAGGKKPHYVLINKDVIEDISWFGGGEKIVKKTDKWTLFALD